MVRDDAVQARIADVALKGATIVVVSLSSLCEFVWVLRRVYSLTKQEISVALHRVLSIENVSVDRPATEAGLAALDAGGDFADGVIAYEGSWLGGETFVSFDRKAVSILAAQGFATRLLR